MSEWRRGGPGKTPIDRVGVWERGTNGRVVDTYTVESLDPFSTPVFSSLSGKPERSVMTLGQWQSSEFEWRFRSPLPTEQPAPEAGGKDREAAIVRLQVGESGDVPSDLLECAELWKREAERQSAACDTALKRADEALTWFNQERDVSNRLASQLEEARKDIDEFKELWHADKDHAASLAGRVSELEKQVEQEQEWRRKAQSDWWESVLKLREQQSELASLHSRLQGETESGEETSFDAISDAFFRYCKTHDEEDAKRLLAFMGGMSYAIHPWEAERHGS